MPDRDSLEGIDYANSPRARFGYKKLCDITDEDIQWLKGAVSRYSAKYVNNVLMVLNKLLKVAEEWRVIDTLPCRIQLLRVTHPTPGFYEYELATPDFAEARSSPCGNSTSITAVVNSASRSRSSAESKTFRKAAVVASFR